MRKEKFGGKAFKGLPYVQKVKVTLLSQTFASHCYNSLIK